MTEAEIASTALNRLLFLSKHGSEQVQVPACEALVAFCGAALNAGEKHALAMGVVKRMASGNAKVKADTKG